MWREQGQWTVLGILLAFAVVLLSVNVAIYFRRMCELALTDLEEFMKMEGNISLFSSVTLPKVGYNCTKR